MATSHRDWRRNAESLLRDVLEFLRLNPGQLTVPERRTWLDRLRAVEGVPATAKPLPAARSAEWPQIDADDPVKVADLLRHVHEEVSIGLRTLLRLDTWELPAGQTRLIAAVIQEVPIRRRYHLEAAMHDEGENIITNVASLVAGVGDSLRECARCHSVFLGRKQGIYCSRECQQVEMANRKTARRRQTRRTPRRPGTRRHKKGA